MCSLTNVITQGYVLGNSGYCLPLSTVQVLCEGCADCWGDSLSFVGSNIFFLKPHYSICHLLALGENMSQLYQPVRNMYILFRILPNLMVIKGVA